jgi:outer membrane biosynthesis protein TonB
VEINKECKIRILTSYKKEISLKTKLFLIFLLFAALPAGNLSAQTNMIFYPDSTSADTVETELAPVPLNQYEVMKMINYPDEARENDIEGKVYILLLVGLTGDVEQQGELTGPYIFYNEVRRVSKMLRFTPGKVNGYPVKVWVTAPFNFKLQKD